MSEQRKTKFIVATQMDKNRTTQRIFPVHNRAHALGLQRELQKLGYFWSVCENENKVRYYNDMKFIYIDIVTKEITFSEDNIDSDGHEGKLSTMEDIYHLPERLMSYSLTSEIDVDIYQNCMLIDGKYVALDDVLDMVEKAKELSANFSKRRKWNF